MVRKFNTNQCYLHGHNKVKNKYLATHKKIKWKVRKWRVEKVEQVTLMDSGKIFLDLADSPRV